jgi:hypothetical protein
MGALLNWIPLLLRRRKREALLREAAAWPIATARLLKATVVEKDALAEGGTSFQDRQVEAQFYFILENHSMGSYFGGRLRSVQLSDSEAHRAARLLVEDLPVRVRFNAQNPDQAAVLPTDNVEFPVGIWPG